MTSEKVFIPYGRQTITKEDIKAVVDVLESPYLTQGPTVPTFEKAITTKVGAEYGIAVNSATSALHIACIALGLTRGDWLWTSPITFVASANCGRYCGASVDFVDIDPSTGLMSIEALKKKLQLAEKLGKLPKIIVPVHLAGSSCDMESIDKLAKWYGFDVIEDASHAIGGTYKNNPVGCCKYSRICVFSFHPVKIITTAEGGLATTNDRKLAEHMKALRSHGITKQREYFEYPDAGPWSYEQQDLGFNYRMNDIQAALGISQLTRLDSVVTERNRLYSNYIKHLRQLPVKFLQIPEDVYSSLHLAIIRLNNVDNQHHRTVFEALRKGGIGVQVHYSAVHLQPYYRRLGFTDGDYPQSELYSNNAISLPLYPNLKEHEQEHVLRILSASV